MDARNFGGAVGVVSTEGDKAVIPRKGNAALTAIMIGVLSSERLVTTLCASLWVVSCCLPLNDGFATPHHGMGTVCLHEN